MPFMLILEEGLDKGGTFQKMQTGYGSTVATYWIHDASGGSERSNGGFFLI
jgi:hypothetical protein